VFIILSLFLTHKHKAAGSQRSYKKSEKHLFHLFRLVVFNKTVVQQCSIETLHNQQKFSETEKKLREGHLTLPIYHIRLTRSLNKRRASSFSGPILLLLLLLYAY